MSIYEFGMAPASRSTKRTPSIVICQKEIDMQNYEKETIENGDYMIKGKKNPKSKSIQDIEKGSLIKKRLSMSKSDDDEKTSKNAYDFVKNHKSVSVSYNTGTSIASNGSMFHPNKFMLNSQFKSPPSTLSTAATVDELDTLNGMDELTHYDKHKEIGNGTDAFVYEVVDRRNKKHVAMKLTKRKSGRYKTEINLLHQLRCCPYVVKLLKVLEDDSVYVLILEQAPMTLEMLLHERCTEVPMQERVAKEIMSDVFKGLKSIHNLGFVHKDMKPENVLIFADRLKRKLQAKIADFGFATRCQLGTYSTDENDTETNNKENKIKPKLSEQHLKEFIERVCDKCGTPGFWAPELVAECVVLDQAFKMDVFSCGVTLYRMLCNEMPFGLFETWEVKKDDITNKNEKAKLAKMKPNFQVVSWIRTQSSNVIDKKTGKPKYEYIRKISPQKLTDDALEILRGMLRIRPHRRFNIDDCLKHDWVKPSKK